MLPPSVAVVLVLALLLGVLWVARRKGLASLALRLPGRRSGQLDRRLRVVERLPLSGQHSLHLVAFAGRLLVVSVSPGGCNTLAEAVENPAAAVSVAGRSR